MGDDRPAGWRWPPNWARRCCLALDHPRRHPEGLVYGNDGSSWAATAGAGDVLTGIAGSLLAAGLETGGRVCLRRTRSCAGGAAGKRWRLVGASALLAAVHPVIGEPRGAPTAHTPLTAHTP